MRQVPDSITKAWKAANKVGPNKPVVRATIQRGRMRRWTYDTSQMPGGDYDAVRDAHRKGVYTSMIFGDVTVLREVRNIKSYSWTRSLEQDVATCTMTIQNSDITPIGNPDENDPNGEFDLPGYFTFSRGDEKVDANRWGYTANAWNGVFVPDAVVKTYEGYGGDSSTMPAQDQTLVQSGVWLIDKVTYTADGNIVLDMRDIGRLLLDQIVFPPVVPFEEYPLMWDAIHDTQVDGRDATGGHWDDLTGRGTASSSNDFYVGLGIQDPPGAYVTKGGGVRGHFDWHALHNLDEWRYWLSTGQDRHGDKVWWQVDLKDPTPVNALRLQPYGGPYHVFISLKGPNGWIGTKHIPYDVSTEGVDIKAGIPFVMRARAEKNRRFDLTLPHVYKKVTAIRITFTRLMDTRVGKYPFRAGLGDMEIYTSDDASTLGFAKDSVLKTVGNYHDYTDIVKWVGAWGGWFWPHQNTGDDYIKVGLNDLDYLHFDSPEPCLAHGNVWGDFMKSGTSGQVPLTIDQFDKRPLMDIISYIRDELGFVFFIDEMGAMVWRMPNLGMAGNPKLGNYLSPASLDKPTNHARTSEYVTIDENETLLDYSTDLDSSQIRERIFVASATGKYGTVIKGFNPYSNGMRRTAGWTDMHFASKKECTVMADMINANTMFNYRRGHVTTPGNPAIQMDDQIRIYERMTNESYFHYVLGITSTLDMEAGTWNYEIDTHWLGERPSDAWVVQVDQLDAATQAYLNVITSGGGAA